MSTRHSKAAKQFLKDGERAQWQDNTLWGVRVKRDRMSKSLPEWEQLRDMASAIKKHTLSHLDEYLEKFSENAQRNGVIVHWAKDADEFNAIVMDILQSHDVRKLVKSKSMLTEECEMNPYLETHGIEVVETSFSSIENMPPKPQHSSGRSGSLTVIPSTSDRRSLIFEYDPTLRSDGEDNPSSRTP